MRPADPIILVDLDHTLNEAQYRDHMINRPMSSADWTRYHTAHENDPPTPVVEIVKALSKSSMSIVIVTGRSQDHEDSTRQWLRKQGILYSRLLMRPENDFTPADKLKYNLIMQTLSDTQVANIIAIIDDHPGVCESLTERLSIASLQVRLPKIANAHKGASIHE